MDNLPDDILECICEKLVKRNNGHNTYPMKPNDLYKLRKVSKSFKRVIDQYKLGYNNFTFNHDHRFINVDSYLNKIRKFDINGLVWCVKNGLVPNDHCLNNKCIKTYKNVNKVFKSIKEIDLFGMGDDVTKSNNVACIDWYLSNKIGIKKNMVLNIKTFPCMNIVIEKYFDIMYFVDPDRFIRHVCLMSYTPKSVKLVMTSQIFADLIPVFNGQHLNIDSYNDLVKHTCYDTQKHYILQNVQKYLDTDFDINHLCSHLSIIAYHCKEWETVKQCLDIVNEKINSNSWVYMVVNNINSKIKKEKTSHLWSYIKNIILFYNYPEETLKLPVIHRALETKINNDIVKSMIDCGFWWSYGEVEQAARNRNKEIMKILAERMI